MICDIFKESQRAAKSATKTIFKGKRDYFYFRTHGGHGPKNYGADFVLNPGISGANDFRIYYFGIDCLMYYESGNMQEAWATSRIAPDYVFLNQIPLVSRQYLNALAKFKGLQEYKDQYDQAILKPTFSVVAILMHNATYSGEITQPVYSWGNLDAVMEDFAKLPQ